MKNVKVLADDQIISRGIHALHKELGPAGTRRFITIHRTREEDSVERHQKWQKSLDKGQFLSDIFPE